MKVNINNFNIDDIVKKIDQKIAELEAEEKREQNTAKAIVLFISTFIFHSKSSINSSSPI